MGQAMRQIPEWFGPGDDPVKTALVQIERLRGLKAGWNGERAAAPDQEAIQRAVIFVQSLAGRRMPIPVAGPTPAGGVYIRWVVEKDREVELVFRGTGGEYLVARIGLPETSIDGDFENVDDARRVVEKYVLTK